MCLLTVPHTIEPKIPIAYHSVVNLFDTIDETPLIENRQEIATLIGRNTAFHEAACRLINATYQLLYDNYKTALVCTNTAKISKVCKRLYERELKNKDGKKAVCHRRLLSAITPQGNLIYDDTIKSLCERVYLIKDDFEASSFTIMEQMFDYAIKGKHEVYACYCPIFGRIEHLLIPDLNLGFVTANKFINPDVTPYRTINFMRFTDIERLKLKKQRLAFNRKVATELISESIKTLRIAKSNHDSIEKHYINSVDWDMVNAKTEDIISRIKSRFK